MKHLKKMNERYIDPEMRPTDNLLIDISKIMELGDSAERSFFSWLSKNNVFWYMNGSDLTKITLSHEVDFDRVKEAWGEIERVEK